MKGDVTSVAIIELPSGSMLSNGDATKPYISDAKGIPARNRTPRQIITLISLERSSSK
jgi:hypothetical protein